MLEVGHHNMSGNSFMVQATTYNQKLGHESIVAASTVHYNMDFL